MNKYGQAALKAVDLIQFNHVMAVDAWETVTIEIFGKGTPSQIKGCPKNTFLALCETGKVKGVNAGSYTRSKKNWGYALKALELLPNNQSLSNNPNLLWQKIIGEIQKKQNSQMDVVLSLWNNGLIKI